MNIEMVMKHFDQIQVLLLCQLHATFFFHLFAVNYGSLQLDDIICSVRRIFLMSLESIVLKSSHKKETEMGTETEALQNMRENFY